MARFHAATVALLATLSIFLAGCAVGGAGMAHHHEDCPVHPGEWSLVIDEINAVRGLAFDHAKADALATVARRPDLTPGEQEHLVCVTLHALAFDHAKQQVLNELIANPAFSPRAKSAILRNLGTFPFDHTRSELLQQMQGRGDVVPPPAREE